MLRADFLLHTKLTPPRQHRRVLRRPGLLARLLEALDYRLTVVHAGTGYGKTTALSGLGDGELPLFWYSVEEADSDPQRFLSYLIAAFQHRLPGFSELPLAILQERGSEDSRAALTQALDALINAVAGALPGPALLIVDDYHFVARVPEINAIIERFVTYLPPNLHVILSCRYPLDLPGLLRWRARGEILEIDRRALAFQPPEIEALFDDTYGMRLSAKELAALAEKTEGWPIALQLVWQGLRNDRARGAMELLARGPTTLAALFDYLAGDVFASQPPEITDFLCRTAVLRELTPAACDVVTNRDDSGALLDSLHDRDLFVVALSEGHYRYHHLFHDFLHQQSVSQPEGVRERHRRAAGFFQSIGDYEEAIYHWLAAEEFPAAAEAIESAGEATLRAGRVETVAQWIDALPPRVLVRHPRLQAYLGDVYRLRSRFEEARAWYQQAEQSWRARGDAAGISRALRGQALVYLDTVRPAEAESLLEEALRLTDGLDDRQARARLLELLAENKLNMGKPDEAESLREEARLLREDGPAEDVLSVRVKLRTGRLEEAQQILEGWLTSERRETEHGQAHPPRAHRETVLILSLIHTFRGQAEQAFALAQEGIALGERLGSPFVTAVGQMRLGHAWQLRGGWEQGEQRRALEEAIRCYEQAITLGDRLAVRRTRLEALWGLTRAYGYLGDLEAAQRAAAEGVEIGQWAGDQWVVALGELALGASYVLAGRAEEAIELLARVLVAFRDCGDHFGRAATRLWLSLAYLETRQSERFAACVEELLALCETHRYDCLFTAQSLLGPPETRRLVPLLLSARRCGRRTAYVNRLLAAMGLAAVEAHPGYQLRAQMLGAFRLWRGGEEVEPREWQRDKARQLFQFLLTHQTRWMQREEIVERLWPDLSPEAATRDFKVALNALNRTIEPERAPDAPFAFILREGTAYRVAPGTDLWVDAGVFKAACLAGLRLADEGDTEEAIERLTEALELYRGDFLPDAIYDDWSGEPRERLRSLYVQAANRLAAALFEQGAYDECVGVCQQILAAEPCWEAAYRLMMRCFIRQGHRALALRTYQRCASTLEAELGVAPSAPTLALYEEMQVVEGGR